ncbi:winged helix-turn-helix transcriptional regulator [Candidatus Woesearchaeota archaeon]|nr:winged helix-turn-helix transcriptional regulator [Candidatus Woesearchaeota archaeon]
MLIRESKITIITSRKPKKNELNEEINWFCDSLGLFGNRDKDKSCYRLFVTLLKALKSGQDLSSDEIAEKVQLSRGTVIHHLHKLIGSGIVVSHAQKYSLRYENLSDLITEIERDLLKTMDKLKKSAEEIDKRLNL